MLEATKKFTEEFKKVKKTCMRKMFDEDMVMAMEPEDLGLMQSCVKLLDSAIELQEQQAKEIDAMNEKLDKILKKFEK